MQFGLRTWMGPGNHVLDKSPVPPWEGKILRRKGRPIVKCKDTLRSSVQKRLNRLRCRLGCGLGWAQGIVLDASSQVLRNAAMATSFGTKIVIWLCENDSNKAIGYGWGLSGRPTECRYYRYLAHRGHCYGNHFLAFCI